MLAAGSGVDPEVQIHVLDLRVPNWREMDEVLSPDEKERRSRFYSERDRQAFTICRWGLRNHLAAAMGVEPRTLRFRIGPYGKPHLCNDALNFNVSHSEDLALIAISELPCVGVDIEYQRSLDDLPALARQNFSPAEQEALQQLPDELKCAGFFCCWSRKEAFIKAVGRGLSFPLKQFDVSLDPRGPAQLLALRELDFADRDWVLHELLIDRNYRAALVTPQAATLRIDRSQVS